MTTGQRMRERRKELGISADVIAEALNISRATVFRYENGDVEKVPIDILDPLSKILKTTPAYLMGWADDPDSFPQNAEIKPGDDADIIVIDGGKAYDASKLNKTAQSGISDLLKKIEAEEYVPTHKIPILGRVAAGLPMYAEQNIEGYTYAKLPAGGKYFALRVKGDSMTAARIFDGDIVVVREQEIVENGEIAIVIVNGYDATVKKFHRDGNIIMLSPNSFNPEHQVQIYDTTKIEVKVVGKVILSQINFE